MKLLIPIFIFFIQTSSFAQDSLSVLSLTEYLGFVKTFHPIVKQANLIITESEAKLLKARGAFDPKIEIDYSEKTFKNTDYYNKLNATFKIPTWYGIELKGNFEENDGNYINPEATLPNDGLYSVGVSIPVAKDLLINSRMAMLKQAKIFVKQAKAEQQLLVNNILFDAANTYFNWLKTYNEKKVYKHFLTNAEVRFKGIKKSFELGEMPAIDTLEARIALNDRKLNYEKARIKFIKTTLELSNYLWLNNNTPLEINNQITPDINTLLLIDKTFDTTNFNDENLDLQNHPKIQSLDFKLESLTIEKRLSLNNLLPKIDLQYNFLSETPEIARSFNTSAYKSGLNVSIPLFLRKERADLKLAQLKINDLQFELLNTRLSLKNKISSLKQEIDSYKTQNNFTIEIVRDYMQMLNGEERKFFMGESSLFLVNSRESKVIEAQLKAIELENNILFSKAQLFNTLAIMINQSNE